MSEILQMNTSTTQQTYSYDLKLNWVSKKHQASEFMAYKNSPK